MHAGNLITIAGNTNIQSAIYINMINVYLYHVRCWAEHFPFTNYYNNCDYDVIVLY